MAQTEGSLWKTLLLRRNVVALLAFLGFFNVYTLRVNLSVAIVAMTKNYTVIADNGTITYMQDFPWDSKQRGNILGSFFYGYVLTQLAGGWLGTKIGGAKVFGTGVFVTALLSLITPFMANLGIGVLIAVRVIEGFFEGVTYPCIHAVWARWAPPQERTRLASFGFSGSFFGTVVAFPACGFFAEKLGWPSTFYIPAVVAIIWCITWFICVKDDPESDPWITENELKFLQDALGDVKSQQVTHPWRAFFRSMPVWAIVSAHFCENWGFYTMLTQLPTFMNDTLQFEIQAAGFLSALPYLVMAITLQIAGVLVDRLRRKNYFTTTQVRKIFNCGAFLSQTVFMISAAFAETAFLTILFITLAVGLGAFSWAAFSVNHLDIAPQHAGVLMGISNTFATFSGIISPSVAGYVVQHKSKDEWRIVFCISGLIYLFGAIFYAIFASGEVQPWAIEKKNENQQNNEKNKEKMAYENHGMTDITLDR
ncbi:sialin-like [Planococcus citri]|uniref:sialin-like n=1 Tax=Planococcus citri TaxID=170843 RepID=UPI0031F79E46